jgi:hypothetical protein
MKNKILYVYLLTVLFAPGVHATSYCRINITTNKANPLQLGSRSVTHEDIKEFAYKLGQIDTNQSILVLVEHNVPSAELLSILDMLHDAKLNNIAILSHSQSTTTVTRVRLLSETNLVPHLRNQKNSPKELEEFEAELELLE